MANKPISMNKIKQIIRCYCQGDGSKKTSAKTGISRNVVRDYIRRFLALNLTLEDIESFSEERLHALFFPETIRCTIPDIGRYERLQVLLPEISRALKRKGMTLEIQWKKYIEKDPEGYSRTQFYEYLREHRRRSGLTMHMEHKAGEKLFVDYCGDKMQIVDTLTGELRDVEIFVSILGCSQLTFVEASLSQKKEDFISSCQHSMEYLGGVPRAIVTDNLKSAVTKSSKYEPILNETFETFAEHYNTVILPTRAYKPKDKALVENAVRLVYQRIFAPLARKTFTSLDAINESILELLEQHNNAPLKHGDSRRKIFEEEEKATLLPLPSLPYEIRKIKECTVMKNGHIGLHEDRHYYSVPYRYEGKKVKLIYSSDQVDVYYQFQKIASHTRDYRRNRYTTVADHMASKHQFLSEWSPDFFVGRGKEISPEVGAFMEKILESKAHPEQGYKACLGVLNLAKRVGPFRITNACKRATEYGVYNYHAVEDILKRRLDQANDSDEIITLDRNTPTHENLRGKQYYQQSLTFKSKKDESTDN